MTLFRTVAPAAEPVTLAEAKAYLRLQHDSEDALLAGLVRAAREEVERATGIALIDQHWRMTLDDWPDSAIVAIARSSGEGGTAVTAYGSEGEAFAGRPRRLTRSIRCRGRRGCISNVGRSRCGIFNGVEIDFSRAMARRARTCPIC